MDRRCSQCLNVQILKKLYDIMPSDWSNKWDERDKTKSGKPIEKLTREQKYKVYGGLGILSMAFFLTLLVFF